jgi:hypothetical protein
MKPVDKKIETLTALVQEFAAERRNLQSVGRTLLPEEQRRLKQLEPAIDHLENGLEVLAAESPAGGITLLPDQSQAGSSLKDGRYQGGNDRYRIDLRVDEQVSGIISADIFTNDVVNRVYLASIRTTPGERITTQTGSWLIVGQDEFGAKVTGKLSLVAQTDDPQQVVGRLYLDNSLHGLPNRTNISFVARWVSKYLRTLGIEMEIEEGVDPPRPFDFKGRPVTIKSCFEAAGFEITEVGAIDRIPRPANPNGWGTTETVVLRADLNKAMEQYGQASLNRRTWELHYLVLSQSTRSNLNGIMFDNTIKFPRQGVAVFGNAIRQNYGIWADRKLIQTSVHELAHALNLVHRFERVVGRADSTSFMNYDWRYKGFDHTEEFWQNFAFSFDPDELEFLRHGPVPAVSPGGEPFHSVPYWADGNGGYTPYYLERPLNGYQLKLKPPLGGAVFAFGQPIFLEIELSNMSGRRLSLPSYLLDPKAGLLQIMIRRITGRPGDSLQAADQFVPIMQRCFDLSASQRIDFRPGSVLRNNLNLTYGSGGFAFAEPGLYEIKAAFSVILSDAVDKYEYIVYSNALHIRVATPKSMGEERDALTLFRDDVGLYFALGGAINLEPARDALDEVRDRRQGKAKTVKDSVVANIVRCEGIDAGRSYVRLQRGEFATRVSDRVQAATLLETLDGQALQAFDAHTAENTQNLAQKHRNAVEQ